MVRRPAAASILLAVLVGSCERPDGEWQELLMADLAVAEKRWSGILIEFGSPAALPYLGEGWSHGETSEDGRAFRWTTERTASFTFETDGGGRRIAWLTCEPFVYEAAPPQTLSLVVNEVDIEPIELRAGRDRYPFELEVAAGTNRVEMRFAYAGDPTAKAGADRRRLAAAFYRFDVSPPDEDPVAGRPGPFALVRPAGSDPPGVYLPAGGSLVFFLRIPEGSSLRVTGGAEAPVDLRAPAGSRLAVEVRTASGRQLVETLEARASGDVLLLETKLDAVSGEPAEVVFRAETDGLWVRPELQAPVARERPRRPREKEERDRLAARTSELNMLFVVLDGATPLRMSLHGYEKPTTPAIDALGEGGVVFTTAVTQAVYTIASMGSLLTGQYPERHQSVSFADRLPESAVTVPGLLTTSGVRTTAFAGNAVVSSKFGLDRGYESFQAAWELDSYAGRGDSVLQLFDAWLSKRTDQRFFAYVHFKEPHFPYNPPPPYDRRFGAPTLFPEGIHVWADVNRYNIAAAEGETPDDDVIRRIRALYDGNMAYADHLVGELLSRLDALGLRETTMVVLTADHGEAMFEHRFFGHNTQLYEESIRVPLIVSIPGLTPRRVETLVELLDLAPTILELMGLGGHEAIQQMQGRSLLPALLGEEGTGGDRVAFSRTLWDKPRYSARTEDVKLIWDSRTGDQEFYRLDEDPAELESVIEEEPIVAGVARHDLFRWLREQEHLRAAPPDCAILSEDESRAMEALGYTAAANCHADAAERGNTKR